MSVSERLVAIRKSRGMTQQEVADKCGLINTAVRRAESGRVTTQIETLLKLAPALAVSITEILDYSEDEKELVLELEGIYQRIQQKLQQLREEGASVNDVENMEEKRRAAIENIKDASVAALAREQAEKLQAKAKEVEAGERGKQKKVENQELLLAEFAKLNAEGQQIAIARLKELTQIDAYRSRKRYNRAR